MLAISYQDRKNKMNELRQAHFHLGFDKEQHNISEHKQNYQQPTKIKPLTNRDSERFEEYRRNPRKTHYELGTDEGVYMSTTHKSYNDCGVQEKAQLSESTKSDLRSHHFVLGFHSVKDPSEYKREFPTKDIHSIVIDRVTRKHNHDFGDQNNYYSTSYGVVHNKPTEIDALKNVVHKDELREQTQGIRKTYIKVGDHKPDFITQNNRYFDEKSPELNPKSQQELKIFLQSSHTVLGTENTEGIKSIQSTTFQGAQPSQRQPITREQLLDFRATHFDLSVKNEPMPQATHKSHFAQSAQTNLTVRSPIKQKANFYIGTELSVAEQKDTQQSVYRNDIGTKFHVKPQQKIHRELPPVIPRAPLILGSGVDDDLFKSEAAKQFDYNLFLPHPEAKTLKADPAIGLDFRNHHYNFGTDKQEYFTHNSAYNSIGERSNLDENQTKNLKIHHFKLGNAKQQFQLHSNEIGSKQGPPNQLDLAKQIDLKNHHFSEYGENTYQTSYKFQTQKTS